MIIPKLKWDTVMDNGDIMSERDNTRQKLLTKQNAISGAKTTTKIAIPSAFGMLLQKILLN